MKLQSYLATRAYPAREFSRRLGISPAAVARYAAGKRIPAPDVMRRIVVETEGAVTPNDFYDLSPVAAERPRTVVTFEIDETLLEEAERFGTDLTALAEAAIVDALRAAKLSQWRERNADAIREANQELAENGLWSDGLRLF